MTVIDAETAIGNTLTHVDRETSEQPWRRRLRTGELNGRGQRMLAALVLGVVLPVQWAADVARTRRQRR